MKMPRPLDFVPFIKLKLGLVILASGMAGLAVFWSVLGWKPPATSLTAVGVALLISQILAHGMTRPLREMTAAAKAMARGDYSRRVRATSTNWRRPSVSCSTIPYNWRREVSGEPAGGLSTCFRPTAG